MANLMNNSCKRTDILEATVGDFGKWQCRIALCMALLKFPMAWFQLGIVFLAPPTDYWCKKPVDFKGMNDETWRNFIAPFGNETNFEVPTRCLMRNIELPRDTKLQRCKWGYEYNRSVIHSSIITEWNLVCGKERLVDITQTTLMLGILLGNIMFGILADKFGRKKVLIITIILQTICGILSSWSPVFEVFLILRFLMALANGGTMITSFVMCMEVVSGKWRSIVPILYQVPFGFGNTIMAVVAYYFRDWRELQLVLSISSGFFLIYIWILPESPRWLLATGKRHEAAKILEKAALENGVEIHTMRTNFLMLTNLHKENRSDNILSVLGIKKLKKCTILLCIIWFLTGLTFYGFSQYLGQIGSDVYFTVSMGGLLALPGTILCVFVIQRFGRKLTMVISYFFVSVCFFMILLVPDHVPRKEWFQMMAAAFGVIGLSVSTPTLYLYTGEIYPTVHRNVGVGFTIMFSRLGCMFSPFLISLQFFKQYLPLLLFGSLTLLQALAILRLPESRDFLPETMEDIEMGEMKNYEKNNIAK